LNQDPDIEKSKRLGITAAFAAFFAWGFMPVYFKFVTQVGALEIIAHRIVWAVPVLIIFLLVRDGKALINKMKISRRTLSWLVLSAILLSSKWFIFVWAVVNDRVLATSLGYFINPLVNVLLGFLFLQERLTAYQKIAVLIAALGTLYLGWFQGATPWIAIALSILFGFYGLVRKRLSVGPITGLMWENLLLFLPAIGYLLWRNSNGEMDFLNHERSLNYILMLAGLVTILPLIWFNTATRYLTLTVVGFFQYIGPTITMVLAVYLWNEPFTQGHVVAFGCIWLGLALISFEQASKMHKRRRLA
jgi:chloramphenicol-sensitive protein RarD